MNANELELTEMLMERIAIKIDAGIEQNDAVRQTVSEYWDVHPNSIPWQNIEPLLSPDPRIIADFLLKSPFGARP